MANIIRDLKNFPNNSSEISLEELNQKSDIETKEIDFNDHLAVENRILHEIVTRVKEDLRLAAENSENFEESGLSI